MTWAELRPATRKLLQFYDPASGWPPPTLPDFWREAYFQELRPFLKSQISKYATRDEKARSYLARGYSMLTGPVETTEDSDVYFNKHKKTILTITALDLLLNGPILTVIQRDLNMPRETFRYELRDLIRNPDFSSGIQNQDDTTKYFAWWSIWHQADVEGHRRDAIDEMVKIGLTPPPII